MTDFGLADIRVVDHLLTTTRAIRKRLDLERPVPLELIEECLEIACQAPTGGNRQDWRFIVVTEPEKRRAIAEAQRAALPKLGIPEAERFVREGRLEGDRRREQHEPVFASTVYLIERLEHVPVLVIPCMKLQVEGLPFPWVATMLGGVMPAAWSFMLAARARGLGTVMTTTVLAEADTLREVLDIPELATPCAMIPVAYLKGDTPPRRAERLPVKNVVFHESWGRRNG